MVPFVPREPTARPPMLRLPLLLLAATTAAACHSYTPAPVDLGVHAATFQARTPTPPALAAAFGAEGATFAVDLADGIDLREARWIAVCFHPDCRLARQHAGLAAVERAHAGTLPDPTFSFDVERILATVPHRWLVGGALGFTLPLNGRLGLQRQLAGARLDERLVAAWLAERTAADAVDAAFVRWSSECAKVEQLTAVCTSLRELAAIADRLAAAGALLRQGARVFTLELTQREFELASASDAVASLALELKQRLGLHPAAEVTFVPTLAVAPRVPDATARRQTLDQSPRVLPASAAYRTAEAELELEVRRQWPDLVLAPGFAEEDAQPRPTLGLSLPLPLWAGNDAAIAQRRAARDTAAEQLRGAFEAATQDLAAAELRHRQTASRRQFVAERLLPLAEQQVEDGRQLASLGQLEPLLLLDALSRAHQAHMAALDAALQEALAVIALNACCATPEPTLAEGTPR